MNVIMFVSGLIAGAAIAFILAAVQRTRLASRLREAESRAVAAETGMEALRAQYERGEQSIGELRRRLEAEQQARTRAETALEGERKSLEDQRKLLEQAGQQLTETFKALSGDVLGAQSQRFLELARQSFDTLRAEADGDLARRQQAIDSLVKPLEQALSSYDQGVKQIESARQQAYYKLENYLAQLSSTQTELKRETTNLVTALRKPQVRGRWGEMSLKRLAELAGMVERCDFCEQPTLFGSESTLRPDMIVSLPGDRQIVVDAKVALDAYLDALEAPSEQIREQYMAKHAAQVKRHMIQLGSKAYWDRLPKAPEFAVLFIPGDSFLAAAVEREHSLIEDGMAQRVVIATPSTLIALLLAVNHGWRQEQIEQSAREISELGKLLYDRINTFVDHFSSVGTGLERAIEAFNRATSSLNTRLIVAARRFKELGAATGKDMLEVEPLDVNPRLINAKEAEIDQATDASVPG
jgi:DNA recombination protein RmuC